MKKVLGILLALGGIFFLGSASVSASGCFHDAISVVNKAGTITRGAYILNVACYQGGQTVIATLGAGTKVRIIGQSAYTKIVLPDGRVGRVGNDRVSESSDWNGVPAFPTNHVVNDYCDTTNVLKCPNAIPPGTPITSRYYKTNSGTPTPVPEPIIYTPPTPEPVIYTPQTPSVIAVTDSMKPKLDSMADTVNSKIDNKYGSNLDGKLAHYKALVTALKSVKNSAPTLADLIDYLVIKFEEKSALLELELVLNIN